MVADRYHPETSLVRTTSIQSLRNQIIVKGITNSPRGLDHTHLAEAYAAVQDRRIDTVVIISGIFHGVRHASALNRYQTPPIMTMGAQYLWEAGEAA